jgi:5-methylcytosine-specific restriction enzyme subunit McrC
VDPFDRAFLNRAFESFLRVFFRRELRGSAAVQAKTLRWTDTPADRGSLLPRMRTDISVRGADRGLVIDAKYYGEPIVEHRGKRILRSAHLYQIYTCWRTTTENDPRGLPWAGALVYARGGESFDFRFLLRGMPLRVLGLDLEAEPTSILDRLRSVWSDPERLVLGA